LEEVEDIGTYYPPSNTTLPLIASLTIIQNLVAFNLINEIDVPETEARIAAFRRENAALIELNIQREERDIQGLQEQEMRERREREEMAEEMRRAAEEERVEREKEKEEIINRLVRIFAPNLVFIFLGEGSNSTSLV